MGTRRDKKIEEAGSPEYVVIPESESEVEEDEEDEEEGGSSKSKRPRKGGDNDASSQYEQIRDQRIKQNKERMQKLGLLDLSLKLKAKNKNQNNQKPKKSSLPPNQSPPRRSSRIMSLAPVNYAEKGREKRDSSNEENENENENEIFIPEGTNPEFYTEEQEKLLGDCETAWELNVDGCDVDGNRIYDPIKGETCHQCRQKTLCQHTSCNKCELGQGQLCGDCLYTRYGENLMEADLNPKWTCPSCRGICNCSRCRKANGWMPTGNIYRKVSKLGYKSVAHYLMQTHRAEKGLEGSGDENTVAEEISQTSADTTQTRPARTRRALRRSY